MKLRKALEKAKQKRQGSSNPGTVPTTGRRAKIVSGGWKPPVYTESLKVKLDEERMLNQHCICITQDVPEVDFYKVLRTKISHYARLKGWRTFMITSPRSSEGKTLTAINLALTFAKSFNQTVMLVDCDLRRQDVHKVLGYESRTNLIDFLIDERPLKDFIVWPGVEKMTVVSGSRTVHNSAELLGSPRMGILIDELKQRYDDRYVLFDTTPLLLGADALALVPKIDGIIIVVEDGKTSVQDVKRSIEILPREKLLGCVLNRQKSITKRGDDYYYYG
jgi:non-specific protein-tyrosine kinase